MHHSNQPDAVEIAQRILEILADGSFSSTYKYAVLLAMVDLCQSQGEDGHLPTTLTTRQLSRAVAWIYWKQVQPAGLPTEVLPEVPLQNKDRRYRLHILRGIRALQERYEAAFGKTAWQMWEVEKGLPAEFAELIREVEEILVRMPLPRLQSVGGMEDRFLYDIAWNLADVDRGKKRPPGFTDYLKRDRRGDAVETTGRGPRGDGFDNRLLLREGVAEALVRLAPLLRAAIQAEWTRTVAVINDFEESRLEAFLFDSPARVQFPRSLQSFLLDLQEGRCFYTGAPLRGKAGWHVDHFVPWSLTANDGLANLVLASPGANAAKSNHLAAPVHLTRWVQRNLEAAAALEDAAAAAGWVARKDATLATARTNYLRAHEGRHLWLRGREFERIDHDAVRRALEL